MAAQVFPDWSILPKLNTAQMKNWLHFLIVAALLVVVAVLWQQFRAQAPSSFVIPNMAATTASNEPVTPLSVDANLNPQKVALGERLFNDPVLSHDNKVSCATCHSLETGGTDRLVRSIGIDGKRSDINAPTVFNSSLNFVQFWDGRAGTLEDQVDGPVNNPDEMGSSWDEAVQRLRSSPVYVTEFGAIYKDGVQAANVRDAIATFERSLVTPDSRFDRYLRGETTALNEQELHGYRLFKDYGCASCHQGAGVGGNLFEKFGVMSDYFARRGKITKADYGRFNVTNKKSDRHVFKVPSLRNIALTGPYFHDGAAASLEEAVRLMGLYQLGRTLTPAEIDSIVQFLNSLTGEYKGKAL